MAPDAKAVLRLRALSRALFGGAQYRAEVGCAIAASPDGKVCIKDLANQLGDPPGTGSVNTELKNLEAAGLLMRSDREPGERRVFLTRQDCSFWTLCEELAQRCDYSIP